MSTIQQYTSLGGSLQPTIDHRGFPFEDTLEIPMTIKESRLENYGPVSGIQNITSAAVSRVEFNIPATSDNSMWNLKDSYFQIKLNVPNISGSQACGPTMLGMDSICSDLQVYFGSSLVSEPHGGGTYPQQAFVKDIITRPLPGQIYNSELLKENTVEELEFLQQALRPVSITSTNGNAPAFVSLTNAYASNTVLCLRFRIKDGVFQTSKFFPSNMNLRIVLSLNIAGAWQENPGANFVAGGQITLADMQFYLNRIFLSDESLKAQNQALMRSPMKYLVPYSKVETKFIATGSTFINIGGLFQGQTRPDVITIFFAPTPSDASKTYPLLACGVGAAFSPTVSNLIARWNGIQYPKPTMPGLSSGDIRTYQLYVDQCLDDSIPFLPYTTWKNYFTVYTISLRDSQEKFFGLAPMADSGALEIQCTFSAATTAAYNMFVVGLTHAKLEISDGGNVNKINYIN